MRLAILNAILAGLMYMLGWHYGEQSGLQQGADGNFQCKIEVME